MQLGLGVVGARLAGLLTCVYVHPLKEYEEDPNNYFKGESGAATLPIIPLTGEHCRTLF